jgi:hypothetical protein
MGGEAAYAKATLRVLEEAEDETGGNCSDVLRAVKKHLQDSAEFAQVLHRHQRVLNGRGGKARKGGDEKREYHRPLIDGLAGGARDAWAKCTWDPLWCPPPGCAELPTTAPAARAWLALAKHTDGCRTVKATGSNARSVVRRCTEHGPGNVGGCLRACGMMWRCDASHGWKPRRRMANSDASWGGKHLADLCPEYAKARRNSIGTVQQEAYITAEVQKGVTPKMIWNTLGTDLLDNTPEAERRGLMGT